MVDGEAVVHRSAVLLGTVLPSAVPRLLRGKSPPRSSRPSEPSSSPSPMRGCLQQSSRQKEKKRGGIATSALAEPEKPVSSPPSGAPFASAAFAAVPAGGSSDFSQWETAASCGLAASERLREILAPARFVFPPVCLPAGLVLELCSFGLLSRGWFS